ncbi:MAG: hypothetical protein EOO42_17890 [Flavobacteriales bacterium]|nr:MAG: hypothetical protein EOO42_17890 [Flavobacteriales bacterium]
MLLLVNSCKKDQDQQVKVEEIGLLKNWFQGNKDENPANFIKGLTPDWEHTYTSTTDGILAVEVDLSKQSNIFFVKRGSDDSGKETMATQANIRLVLLKNTNTGAMDGCYMVITGNSKEEMGNLHYKKFTPLSGKVMYFDLQGSFVNGYGYEAGKIVNKINRGNPADVSSQLQLNSDPQKTPPASGFNKKLMVVDVSTCNTQPVDVYEERCGSVSVGPLSNPVSSSKASSGKTMSGGNQTCIMVYSETIYQTTCEYTNPAEQDGGGYGGSGGGQSNESNNNTRDIHTKTQEPCISKTVDTALKSSKNIMGIMSDIIKNFDNNKTVTINIFDGHIFLQICRWKLYTG